MPLDITHQSFQNPNDEKPFPKIIFLPSFYLMPSGLDVQMIVYDLFLLTGYSMYWTLSAGSLRKRGGRAINEE